MSPALLNNRPAASPQPQAKETARQLRNEILSWAEKLRSFLSSGGVGGNGFAMQARLIPIDAQGRPRHACPVRLKGFDERGLAFEHARPLPDRRALFAIDSPAFGCFTAEVDLGWSSYIEGGRYASGGRIVQLVSPSR